MKPQNNSVILIQTWALVRRYCIHLYRSPIFSLIRIILWPAIVLVSLYYVLIGFKDNQDIFGDVNPVGSWLLPTITMLSTIFHVYHFSTWLVANKATKMKSIMISMGLKQVSWYLANIIGSLACTLPITMTLAGLTAYYAKPDITLSIIFLYLLFTIHLTGTAFAISSPIKSQALISFTLLLVALESQFHNAVLWIMQHSSERMQGLVLFAASLSPYESVRIFFSSDQCKSCTTHLDPKTNHVYQSSFLIFAAMTFWTIVAFAFARWFDEVCPWQEDTAVKSPLFCFSIFSSDHNSDTDVDSLHPDPRYFERSISNSEIGIRIRRLFKSFNNLPVVRDISFNIHRGETTLLLGHNGAGKTTLMNMILGKLSPDNGKVLIESDGQLRNSDNIDGLGIGFCPQTSILDESLNVYQHLELFYDIKFADLPTWQREGHIKQTIDDVSLTNHMFKRPSELSGGMKRKLSLAMAFVGKSTILILDEPSSGLDPDSRVFVWDAIRRYRLDRTVLLSTQHMEEADYLGDRIAIMSEGNIICCGSTNFLNDIFGSGYKLRIECSISKKDSILAFIHKHFPRAKVPESEQIASPSSTMGSDPIQDIVIELTDDKSRDSESHLIRLLEEIETNSREMSIKSYGLKSSSIEDVMLHTSRHLPSKIDDSINISPKSNDQNRERLTHFLKTPEAGMVAKQLDFLYAMLTKNFNVIKNDWLNFTLYRLVLASIAAGASIYSLGARVTYFKFSIVEIVMVVHLISYPAHENASKFKIMQLTSKTNIFNYWLSQFLTDIISILILVVATITSLSIFNHSYEFVRPALTVYSLISFSVALFGISSALLAYILSTVLTNGRRGVDYFFFILLLPAIISIASDILSVAISKDLSGYINVVNLVLIAIMPPSALQYFYYGLATQCYIKEESCLDPKSPSPVVFGLTSLIGQIVFYGLVLVLIEYYNINLWLYLKKRCGCLCFWIKDQASLRRLEMDVDVLGEASKANNLIKKSNTQPISRDTFSLVAADLQKSYSRGIKVIDKLSFTINQRECFGLLGVNGAGKSTTFSMLVAESSADSGKIWLNGHFLDEDVNKYRQKLGYDPQSNPEMFLTAEEALTLMARLRRVNDRSIPALVSTLLEILDMSEHRGKIACTLSGGTQRKLALGMSLIGSPPLLALDEPTAGVDPVARRGIWWLLRALRVQSGCSIIISSHAMEECEAICDRISIMAQGNLRCIGSFLHLRSRFSQGCSVRLQFSSIGGLTDAEAHNKVVQEVLRSLTLSLGTSVKLADTNVNSATFNITDKTMKHSTIFKVLREFKKKYPKMNYMINDSSLEDIFIALAREQQEIEHHQPPHRLTGGFC